MSMPPGASETLKDIEVFRNQARITHQIVQLNVKGLSHEESLIQVSPGGNCLNWVLGHLVVTYETILPMLGQETVIGKEALKRYDRGSAPLRDPAEAREFQELLDAWDKTTELVDNGLAELGPEALDGPMRPGASPQDTLRSFLSLIFFHQAYHAGQTGLLRRIAGKEGAIP
jgi:uncharacterized damage-inducible protein DinB